MKDYILLSKELLKNRSFNINEKLIIAKVWSFNRSDGGCFATNNYFADLLGISGKHISRIINGLIKKGILIAERTVINDQNTRKLTLRGGIRISTEGLLADRGGIPISTEGGSVLEQTPSLLYNSINYEITLEKRKDNRKDSETERFFGDFWKMYPKNRKPNKTKCERYFRKAISKVPFADLIESLQAHLRCEQWQQEQYIPHCSTWLNDKRYLHKPEPAPPKDPIFGYVD